MRRFFCALLALMLLAAPAMGEEARLPQIDSSTARIPITEAIYGYFTEQGMEGPAPICSKTHGAWLNLAGGAADILFLIAPTADEIKAFAESGVDIEMKIFGYDGLVFLGNAANPVKSLTAAQIRAIYSGRITNWSRIEGGPDADMKVYIRNPESGSQRLFENLVWTGYEKPDFQAMGFAEGEVGPVTARRVTRSDDMGEVTRSVMQNAYSIGFNIMSYIDSEFLQGADEAAVVRATGSVNLRGGPGLDYVPVGQVSRGTKLEYLGETSIDERGVAWYRVAGEDETWVSSRYSELEASADALKLFAVNGFMPTTENFQSGDYPFVTTSYAAIRADEPEDSPARMLFDWLGSEESRRIISENSTLSVSFSQPVVLRCAPRDAYQSEALSEMIDRAVEDLIAREDLYAFNEEELALLWRGLYASAGLFFWDEKNEAYFSEKDWYDGAVPRYDEAEVRMSEEQRRNADLILGYLAELRRAASNRADAPRTLSFSKNESRMSGEDVEIAQRMLAARGYLAEKDCDGVYGSKSADAVARFQRDNGREATGTLDAVTRMMLLS